MASTGFVSLVGAVFFTLLNEAAGGTRTARYKASSAGTLFSTSRGIPCAVEMLDNKMFAAKIDYTNASSCTKLSCDWILTPQLDQGYLHLMRAVINVDFEPPSPVDHLGPLPFKDTVGFGAGLFLQVPSADDGFGFDLQTDTTEATFALSIFGKTFYAYIRDSGSPAFKYYKSYTIDDMIFGVVQCITVHADPNGYRFELNGVPQFLFSNSVPGGRATKFGAQTSGGTLIHKVVFFKD